MCNIFMDRRVFISYWPDYDMRSLLFPETVEVDSF